MRSFVMPLCLLAAAAPAAFGGKPATAVHLTVRLTTPIDAALAWRHDAADAAGHIVEYINHPTDEWVILGFCPAGVSTFTHPSLAPDTPYQYRVRPFHGPASNVVEVTIAQGLSDKAYADSYAQPEDYSWAPPQTVITPGAGVIAPRSIRNAATRAHAAPAGLKAHVVSNTVSGFKLTWSDRSSDEEGFFLERVRSDVDFVVCAVMDRDINAFGWALEPPDRTGRFRVRAYYYGAPSNIVAITTGADPGEAGPGPASDGKPRS